MILMISNVQSQRVLKRKHDRRYELHNRSYKLVPNGFNIKVIVVIIIAIAGFNLGITVVVFSIAIDVVRFISLSILVPLCYKSKGYYPNQSNHHINEVVYETTNRKVILQTTTNSNN